MSEHHREEKIVSHAKPFSGQRHRSSGNFSTRYIQDPNGKKPQSLLWEIIPEKSEERNNISFKVYQDVPYGIDRKRFKGIRITNGQRTKYIDERKIYIHSPRGATAPFTVKVTGMDTEVSSSTETDVEINIENED